MIFIISQSGNLIFHTFIEFLNSEKGCKMSVKMLIFDYRNSEKSFFEQNKFDNFDITFYQESLNSDTIKNISQEDMKEACVISVFVNSDINKDVINSFKNLRIIATRSTGVNHINLEECRNRHISVLHVENYGETAVAQFCWGLIIDLVRKIIPASNAVKRRDIKLNGYTGRDLNNLTIGIIGTGAIGSEMCKIARAFSMNILTYDIRKNLKLEVLYDVHYTDLEDLLKNSDIITLHTPLTDNNYHMIDEKEFEIMKPSAFLINTSRGELVDTNALFKALTEKKIAGVATDVLECENANFNKNNLDFIKNLVYRTKPDCLLKMLVVQKLSDTENVIITPHIAYDTQEAIESLLKTTFESIKDNLQGGHKNQFL